MASQPNTDGKKQILPQSFHIGDEEGFVRGEDIFSYKPFGETLGNLFKNATGMRVVLLDGDWGTGKTVFVKQWAGHMRRRDFEVIYIDAFANDFQQDPFSLITGAVLDRFGNDGSKLKEAAKKIITSVMINATKVASSGVVALDDIQDLMLPEKSPVGEFKKEMEALTEKKPVILVIDELDRCRPDFALELIERAKHIFDVQGLQFLLVSNREQLAQMLSAAYGLQPPDAVTYLDKFFDFRVSLPRSRNMNASSIKIYFDKLVKTFGLKDKPDAFHKVAESFCSFAAANGFSLRDIEKILTLVASFDIDETIKRDNSLSVFTLALLRVKNEDLYRRLANNEPVWRKISEKYGLEMRNCAFYKVGCSRPDTFLFEGSLLAITEDEAALANLISDNNSAEFMPHIMIRYFANEGWQIRHQFILSCMEPIDHITGFAN